MNFKWDLKGLFDRKRKADSSKAQLRERSKQSIARPKAVKNITSKRAISNRGYLTDLGLVPLANPQEAITQVK